MLQNINLHDCITIIQNHKDPEKKYYGSRKTGVVTEIAETKLTIRTAENDIHEEDFADKDYHFEIAKLSEFEFIKEIQKNIARKQKRAEDEFAELQEMKQWLSKFQNEISFLGRLKRFISLNLNNLQNKI